MASLTQDELEAVAVDLWHNAPRGAVVWLSGELGSGKTTFVQALTRAAGASLARSPTFALVHEYATPEGPLIHVDCYRLKYPDEAVDLDLLDLTARARLLAIEWPERAGHHAPAPYAHFRFAHAERTTHRELERVA